MKVQTQPWILHF